jgi:hypothetical protein
VASAKWLHRRDRSLGPTPSKQCVVGCRSLLQLDIADGGTSSTRRFFQATSSQICFRAPVELYRINRAPQQAVGALVDAKNAPSMTVHGTSNNRADNGVKPGAAPPLVSTPIFFPAFTV